MRKVKKGYILSFLLGAITFSGITGVIAYTILAKDVSYTPNNTTWKVDNVQSALNDLYSKAKPEYTDETTITPTESTQTLNTKDKILKNNIIINAIPSTYKNLTTTTDVLPNSLLNGVKAYTSDGTLVTGNLSTTCVSGIYTKPANSQININFGFTPSRIEMYFLNSNQNGKMLVIYDENIGYFYQVQHPNDEVSVTKSAGYTISNNSIISNYINNSNETNATYRNQITYYYMACK